jgi:hypothetical protein
VITRSTIAMQPSRRREPHGNEDGNPKRRTLQRPTLNPSAFVVFSRCHREVRGGVSRRPDGATGDVSRSSTRRVVNVMRLGCTGPSARFAGASAADISAGTSSRAAASGRGDKPWRLMSDQDASSRRWESSLVLVYSELRTVNYLSLEP